MALPKEIFLSHSSRDRRFVARLAEMLRSHGISVWYSKTSIRAAQQWHDEIGSALKRCDWVLVVLSPNAVKSMWMKRELHFALREESFEDRIVPVLYQPCDFERLSWVLPNFQQVDFHRSFEEGCQELLKIWDVIYLPESEDPQTQE